MADRTVAVFALSTATTLVVVALILWLKWRRRPAPRHLARPTRPGSTLSGWALWLHSSDADLFGVEDQDDGDARPGDAAEAFSVAAVSDLPNDPTAPVVTAFSSDWWAPMMLPGNLGALVPVTQLHPGDGFVENDWTLHVGLAGVDVDQLGVCVPVVEFPFPLHLRRDAVVRVVEIGAPS